MDYSQTLEKAVLQHAAEAARKPAASPDRPTKIPGFPDQHVWGTARHLAEKGLISTTSIGDNGELIVGSLSVQGSERMKQLAAVEEKEQEEQRRRIEEAKAAKKKKPFWRFW